MTPSGSPFATAAVLLLAVPASAFQRTQIAAPTGWKEIDAPTVTPIAGLSQPYASQPFHASLRTTSEVIVRGAGSAWSADDGFTWTRDHRLRTPLLFDIEHHPADPQILWGASVDVWKSTDGGTTWKSVYSPSNYVERLAVDPGDPDRIYGVGGVVVPDDTFHWSTDGGATWSGSIPFFLEAQFDVAVVPGPGLGAILLASSNGIQRSTDGGATFVAVQPGVSGRVLEVAAQNPSVVWCISVVGNGQTRLWRSLDGGQTWSETTAPAADLTDVAAQPTDPARACVVGRASGAFVTADGGQTWTIGTGLSPIADLTSLSHSPPSPDTLLAGGVGGHGGLWRSTDGGLQWQRSNKGLPTSIPDLFFDGAGRVWAAGLGVPLRRSVAGSPWTLLDYADGLASRVTSLCRHPADPTRIAWVHVTPEWWVYDRVLISQDDGATWQHVTPPGAQNSTREVRRVAFAPDGTLYAGAQYGDLYWSTDLGTTWSHTDVPWNLLRDLVQDPHEPNRLHATDNTSYYASLDRGLTWTQHLIGNPSNWYPEDLTVSPALPDRLFLLAGYSDKVLYESRNGGEEWVPIGHALPAPITRLAVHPDRPRRMLLGTEGDGVHLSLDGGGTFAPWSTEMEGATIVSLAFDPLDPNLVWASCADGRLFVRNLP